MVANLRVVHYVNQFFGGIGAEEQASVTPLVKNGFVNLGKVIQKALDDKGEVVATIICGDNYFAERTKETVDEILHLLVPFRPDVVIAGPAFNGGRYGFACGEVCKTVQDRLGIPAVTGMFEENPGVDLYRKDVYIIRTDASAKDAGEAASRMTRLALKLAHKEKIGKASEEGYFPRGFVRNEFSEKTAAHRAVSMLMEKIKGEPVEPELELPKFNKVKPAVPIRNVALAKIALVTDGGLVRKGNPDRMESHRATKFIAHDIRGIESLSSNDFEANHIGYDKRFVNEDPNRLVPLDVLRDLEKERIIGKVHEKVFATAGVSTTLENAMNIGRGIAEQLRSEGVDGVILTST